MTSALKNAAITGWGKCLPPAVLTNAGLATILDTSDEWISSRTGIRERRVSHVPLGDLVYVAAARALACAGMAGKDVQLIVCGTTSFDDQVPNVASGIQRRIGADGCAAMDVNTACTSFLYSLSTATALIRSGVVANALVVGAEVITPFIDWTDRNTAVLFGDGGAAVVLETLEHAERRGAKILGELVGYGLSGDAYHMSAPAPEGEGAQRAMRMCLADGDIDPARVDYVNAHGTSTPLGDIAETQAVKAVFGKQAERLVFGSTKSMTGHLLGGAGALEFCVALLAAMHGVIPPTINHDNPDPQCDLDCAPNVKRERKIDVALSNAFGFGGHNASLAVRAV